MFGVWCLVFGVWCFWCLAFGVWDLGFGVRGLGVRVRLPGSGTKGLKVQVFGFRALYSRFMVHAEVMYVRVWGLGLSIQGFPGLPLARRNPVSERATLLDPSISER